MAQLFRDQCRDAYREERFIGIVRLWQRALPDFLKTCALEQITNIERNPMTKYLTAKNSPTLLLILGLALGFLSFGFTHSPELLRALVSASATAILAKALLELFRPSSEWLRMALGTALLMFVYAIFMPAWAKADQMAPDLFKLVVTACLFANPAVVLVKLLQFVVQRRRG